MEDTNTDAGVMIEDAGKKMTDPEMMNLRQLRIELKRIGLSPSGSKADLVRRYKMAISGEEVPASEVRFLWRIEIVWP